MRFLADTQSKEAELIAKGDELSKQDKDLLAACELRVRNAELKPQNEECFITELAQRLHAKLQKPQRLLVLTSEQERHRYKCTCQHFDWVMHLVAFGSKDQLKQYVSDPEKVISMRRRCVLVFIDQAPWFVKVKSSQQLYHE